MDWGLPVWPSVAGWTPISATREISGDTIRDSYSFRAPGRHQADRISPGEVPPPSHPLHHGDMFGTASPSLFFQPPLGAALLPRAEAGGRATQALGFAPNPARVVPSLPGALPTPATGGRTTHQDQDPALPPRLGQGTSTNRFLQPESRDSPDPRQPHSPGPLAAAAADGESETSGGSTMVASEPAADSGRSSPASAESPEDGPITRV